MSSEPLRIVAGVGFAKAINEEVVVANIGSSGNVFAGTFIGRTAYYAWDFVTTIYTDKDGALYVGFVGGDFEGQVKRNDPQRWTISLDDSEPVGTFRYDPSTGDFRISNLSPDGWVEGTVMGTYAAPA
jgi:hypothetical protein